MAEQYFFHDIGIFIINYVIFCEIESDMWTYLLLKYKITWFLCTYYKLFAREIARIYFINNSCSIWFKLYKFLTFVQKELLLNFKTIKVTLLGVLLQNVKYYLNKTE